MPRRFNYSGANFGKREKSVTPSEEYIRATSALQAAKKYYATDEFEQLMVELRAGLITVRIYDDGIIVDRPPLRPQGAA